MKIKEFLSPGFEVHQDLNPHLWQGNNIKPDVKNKLLTIARHFADYVDIEFPILDVVVTGGQTGKYYTDRSDLDLHLITDYSKIDCDQEVEELFDTKRLLYKEKYNITVKNIEVELYVEDVSKPAVGGSYSLLKDKWLRLSTSPTGEINQKKVNQQAEKLSILIRRIISSNDLEKLQTIKKTLKAYRQAGLSKDGEFGVANLTFKSLRNSGIIQELLDKIKELESEQLSLRQ